jgi:hypothetical protein
VARAALLLAVAGLACAATTQRVALDVGPAPVEVFVDGDPVPGAPVREIELRADRPHVLFFKRDGYQAERVVLRSVRDAGGDRLEPATVRVLLVPVSRTGAEIEVELE